MIIAESDHSTVGLFQNDALHTHTSILLFKHFFRVYFKRMDEVHMRRERATAGWSEVTGWKDRIPTNSGQWPKRCTSETAQRVQRSPPSYESLSECMMWCLTRPAVKPLTFDIQQAKAALTVVVRYTPPPPYRYTRLSWIDRAQISPAMAGIKSTSSVSITLSKNKSIVSKLILS